MAIVLSLTAKQQEWLADQLNSTESPVGAQIYEKLIRPTKAKQSSALLDAIVDSSLGAAANTGSDSSGSGTTLNQDGSIVAPEPEWDDSGFIGESRTGGQVLQPGSLGVDLGLDDNQHPDGFSGETNPTPELAD